MFYKRVCIEWVNVKSAEGGEYKEDDEKGVVVVVGSSAHAATLWWMIVSADDIQSEFLTESDEG
jgi:hypothetical protein